MARNLRSTKANRGPTQAMIRRTLFIMAVCGIVAFIVLAGRLFKLMIVDHEKYEAKALAQQTGETVEIASRGAIYDSNMKVLAMSSDVYNVFVSPAEAIKNDEDTTMIADGLAGILGIDRNEILLHMTNEESWYEIIAKKVEPEVADEVSEFASSNGLTSVHLETSFKRYYPYGSLASHVIGFVGGEGKGQGGVEYEYNSILSGASGRTVRAQTAQGKEILFTNYEDSYSTQNGYNAVLTLDSTIQYYVEKRLQEAVDKYSIRNGAGTIVMNVKTGGILAMASLGNFDLNDYLAVSEETELEAEAAESDEEADEIISAARQKQWRNKCLSDTYEPGSTFKIITLSTALQEGVVDDDFDLFCGGNYMVTGDTEPRNCWNTSGHGEQTITQATQHSCNVAFMKIGLAIGAETFYKYCDAFGFLNESSDTDASLTGQTGIDLPGESGSIWWSENVFFNPDSKSQLAAASFGQTFTITPLQLITAVSACVNGGYLMEPYVVKELTDDDGNTVYTNEPTVVRQVISEETSKQVCEILEKVVNDPVDGTGKNAYVAGYRIGGKTATSEKVTELAETGEKDYIVSFVGFAPADDPQIAILTFLDSPDPESGIYISGGQMGAPTVGAMFSDILPYLGVEAEYSEEEAANMDKSVPSVTGLSREEAMSTLEEQGLRCRIIGDGTEITTQLPSAHSVIATGSEVILYADAEPSDEVEEMIDLTDLTYTTARDRLAELGLFISTSSSVSSPSSQIVLTQNIAEGEEVKHGTVINVTLQNSSSGMLGRY